MLVAALQAILNFSERGRAPEATKKQVAEILQLQPHQVRRSCCLPSEGRDAHRHSQAICQGGFAFQSGELQILRHSLQGVFLLNKSARDRQVCRAVNG